LRREVIEADQRTGEFLRVDAAEDDGTAVGDVLGAQGDGEGFAVGDVLLVELVDEVVIFQVIAGSVADAGDAEGEVLRALAYAEDYLGESSGVFGGGVG
jgi:hypothetical protein